MSEIDYAARVQRGAALLDEKWPTWATDVDLEILDIRNGYHCMTAQYDAHKGGEGYWGDGMERLGILEFEDYAAHGFNGDYIYDEDGDFAGVTPGAYATLNAIWRSLILQRRSAAPSPEVTE